MHSKNNKIKHAFALFENGRVKVTNFDKYKDVNKYVVKDAGSLGNIGFELVNNEIHFHIFENGMVGDPPFSLGPLTYAKKLDVYYSPSFSKLFLLYTYARTINVLLNNTCSIKDVLDFCCVYLIKKPSASFGIPFYFTYFDSFIDLMMDLANNSKQQHKSAFFDNLAFLKKSKLEHIKFHDSFLDIKLSLIFDKKARLKVVFPAQVHDDYLVEDVALYAGGFVFGN